MRQRLIELIARIDTDDPCRLAHVAPVGPELALELVDDGLARDFPRYLEELLRHGLKVLTGPTHFDSLSVARALVRAAMTSSRLRLMVANGLRDALVVDGAQQAAVTVVQARIPAAVQELGADPSLNGLGDVRAASRSANARTPSVDCSAATKVVELLADTDEDRQDLTAIRAMLCSDRAPDPHVARQILGERRTAEVLELALEELRDQRILGRVRQWLLPEVGRTAVGAELTATLEG